MSELELESLAIEQISSPEIRDQVLQLTDRINTLADEGHGRIDDLTLAQGDGPGDQALCRPLDLP